MKARWWWYNIQRRRAANSSIFLADGGGAALFTNSIVTVAIETKIKQKISTFPTTKRNSINVAL